MDVHLVDGTYELFRHYYALPSARDEDGREVAAVRGVLASVLGMIREGATHIAVARRRFARDSGLWEWFFRPTRGPWSLRPRLRPCRPHLPFHHASWERDFGTSS